jgi:adenylate cyclase
MPLLSTATPARSAHSIGPLADPCDTVEATVLFVDLRGYTALSEQLPAEQIVPLLQAFYRVLVAACATHGGRIYHVAGDGMMAAFGVGITHECGAGAALAAAHEMLDSFAPVALHWYTTLSIASGIGIGIHTGKVALLTIEGPPAHEASTLIGDTVNIAARLCSRARAGEILFSDSVAAMLGDTGMATDSAALPPQWMRLSNVLLRGRIAPLDIWCIASSERLEFRSD